MQEEVMDTTGVELEDRQMDASVRNPADIIQSYDVIITDGKETHKCRTHHYTLEDCAAWAIQNVDKNNWEVIGVEQTGTHHKLTNEQLMEYKK